MRLGKICQLTTSYGSRWGRIQAIGSTDVIFFNMASLPEGTDFAALREGQMVEFEEQPDRANGKRAVCIVLGDLPTSDESYRASARGFGHDEAPQSG